MRWVGCNAFDRSTGGLIVQDGDWIGSRKYRIDRSGTDFECFGPYADRQSVDSPPHQIPRTRPQNKNREARSQGADENYSSNPILFISIIIAVLVIAGGKGFFYQ